MMEKEFIEIIKVEYLWRLRQFYKSKLSRRDKIDGTKTWPVSLLENDRKTIMFPTRNRILYPKCVTDSVYVP